MNTTTQKISFDPRRIADIATVISENQKIVNLLIEKEGMKKSEAELLFSDTLRFLFLCSISEKSLSPNTRLDLGWHHFILNTKEYTDFCESAFGKYIHHSPFTNEDKSELKSNPYKETIEIAKSVFNELSENWYNQKCADCCEGGDCSNSAGGCSHCQ